MVALGIYLVARAKGVEEVRRVLTVFTDVTAEFSGVVRPGDTVTISARKVFFRRMKLRAEVEMRKADGSLVASATVAGMGVEADGAGGAGRVGSMSRRVVVTGMGVVAPNAIGLEDFDAALRAGRSGIRHLPQLAELKFGCTVGGVPAGRRRDRGGVLRPGPSHGDERQPPLRRHRGGGRVGRRRLRAPGPGG